MQLKMTGQVKYPQLFSLANCVLSISNGNNVPERGFSVNKYLPGIHGNSSRDDEIIALRMVKDDKASVGGIMNVSINRQLLSSEKLARQRYESDLNAK